jgi:hypothetical protein
LVDELIISRLIRQSTTNKAKNQQKMQIMGVLTIYRKNSNQLVSQYSSRIPIKSSSQRVTLDLAFELSLLG